jgi:4'-phosphopantetheinyl transferase EntD
MPVVIGDGAIDDAAADRITFRLDLPHGRCVGIEIRAGHLAAIHADERRHAAGLGPARQPSFHAGRRALRLALADLGIVAGAILPDNRGAPEVPAGALGSISHKRTCAVGLAALRTPIANAAAGEPPVEQIGVDLEEVRRLRANIAPRVLTPAECEAWSRVAPELRDRFVLECFSIKEAFFKAVNRVVGPRISFQAVSITNVGDDGLVDLHAPWLTDRGFSLQGWLGSPDSGLILSSVRLRSSGFTQPSSR